jgi:D-beta-D-heptose 7-phosphate kinase/D-beta-D-heptose 1-phosphate adenosyltransferase
MAKLQPVEFSSISVLCIGDVMLDRFVYSDMERISPEAPVPVLRLNHSREMLGGAGNVVNNIASLGGRAVLVGLIGRDEPGKRLQRILASVKRVHSACVETEDRPTICKTRYIAGHQQVVRTDEESQQRLTDREAAALMAEVRSNIGDAKAVVLADYGKGVLDDVTTGRIIDLARSACIPVFVDPKHSDFSRYRGATCITPNLKELAAAAGIAVGNEAAVVTAARYVMEQAEARAILATRSELGMMLVESSGEVHIVAARAREVFDVSGAGDTVIAAMALCHAAGRSLAQAMHVANAAASVVVSKLGTATADMSEVMNELDAQDHERYADATLAMQPLSRIRLLVDRWKHQGLRVGFTNGCFDIVHSGHVALLAQARAECDRLVVALNSDSSVRRLKGTERPLNALEARARVIAALRDVDCVTSFEEDTPREMIAALLPDVLVKGADYTLEQVVGADLVQAAGGRVVLAGLVAGESSSRLIAALQRTESVA